MVERKKKLCYTFFLEGDFYMKSNCESCAHYEYDEDYECYTCQMNLDEDELYKFVNNTYHDCPYYSYGDEYAVVRHQM